MPTSSFQRDLIDRDGTSQAQRSLPALAADYVQLEERKVKDWLDFAQAYAAELNYYNLQTQVTGDWTAFLDLHSELVAKYIENPTTEELSAADIEALSRPHRVLFFSFLKILEDYFKPKLNELGPKHLNFYYKDYLGLSTKAATPDQVHTIFQLSPNKNNILVPQSTLLLAGKDSSGKELFYRTEDEIVVNKAEVSQLKSVFVEKEIIGLREARQLRAIDNPQQAFLDMLEVALGDPRPGDPLPAVPSLFIAEVSAENPDADFIELCGPYMDLAEDATTPIGLSFAEIRQVLRAKSRVKPDDIRQEELLWADINLILAEAGANRQNGFSFPGGFNPIDFHSNFQLAINVDPIPAEADASPFDQFPLIDDIYDLYEEVQRSTVSQDLLDFVTTTLFFRSVDRFKTMMKQVKQIRSNWQIIYSLLENARQLQNPSFDLEASLPLDYTNSFNTVVAVALPPFQENGAGFNPLANPLIRSLDAYLEGLDQLSAYFRLPIEDLHFTFKTYRADPSEDDLQGAQDWSRVYDLMQQAYTNKFREDLDRARIHSLIKTYEDSESLQLGQATAAFDQMVREALGDPNPGDELPGGFQSITEVNPVDVAYISNQLFLSYAAYQTLLQIRQGLPQGNIQLAAQLLNEAEVKKRGYPSAPSAQIESLNHIYAAADAQAVEVSLGLEGEESMRWRTFGEGQKGKLASERNMTAADIGFAIRSPMLQLSGGNRQIRLRLSFTPESKIPPDFSDYLTQRPFRILLSTVESWYEIPFESLPTIVASYVNTGTPEEPAEALLLDIDIHLDEQVPAITALSKELGGLGGDEPVLKLILREYIQPATQGETEQNQVYQNAYQAFEGLVLDEISIRIGVTNLNPAIIQNDQRLLDPAKPFEPFGTQVRVGSSFLFAHPEIAFKKIEGLQLDLFWMGAPEADLSTYYANYGTTITNNSFIADLQLFDKESLLDIQSVGLMGADATAAHGIAIGRPIEGEDMDGDDPREDISVETLIQAGAGQENYTYKREFNPQSGARIKDWNRYFKLKLDSPGFLHEVYPSRVSQLSIKLATDIANPAVTTYTDTDYQINPPYTPQLEKISIGYRTDFTLNLSTYTSREDLANELLHIHPFGYREIVQDEEGATPFLPQKDFEGELYIGIDALEPPQNLALLLQVAEGSADPDLELATVEWHFLQQDTWMPMDQGAVLSDSSNGLINSGILRLSIPANANNNNNLLPEGLHWLRARVLTNSQSVCDMVAIRPNAVVAVFEDKGNAADHLATPLTANTITKLSKSIPGIKGVEQPYSSFGGKLAEEESFFNTRVSERLRHKQRALSLWDYEHLVLDQFAEIYKAKCLPADIDALPDQAGQVEVVVIPDIKGKLPFDPFEPKAPINLLKDIEGYLQQISPPFAEVKVRNPQYIQLKVRFAVKFLPEKDVGFHLHLLEEELKKFLAPWAYEEGADIEFGGRIYANAIVNFVDERSYVDYMAGITLFTSTDGINFTPAQIEGDDTGIKTDIAAAIWVSAREHEIDIITDQVYEADSFEGVGHMQVELDFQVE